MAFCLYPQFEPIRLSSPFSGVPTWPVVSVSWFFYPSRLPFKFNIPPPVSSMFRILPFSIWHFSWVIFKKTKKKHVNLSTVVSKIIFKFLGRDSKLLIDPRLVLCSCLQIKIVRVDSEVDVKVELEKLNKQKNLWMRCSSGQLES